MKIKLIAAIHAFVLLAFSNYANATLVAYTDLSAWQAAAGSTALYDFNNDTAADFSSQDFGPFTVTQNTAFDLDLFTGATSGNIDGSNFLSYYTQSSNQSISLAFDASISAFAFDWTNTDGSNDVLQLIIGSTSLTIGGPGSGFFGVVENTGASLGSISFSDTSGGGGYLQRANLDNLRFSTVPEPSTLALFGLGLIGFGLRRKHRA